MYINIHTHKQIEDGSFAIYNLPWGSSCDGKPYSIGVHPWDVEEVCFDDVKSVLNAHSRNSSFLAVGEIGLDRLHKHSWEMQLQFFELQLQWANDNNYPVIIHCVRAYSDVLEALKKNQPAVPLIFHDFSGNATIVNQLSKWDSYFSLGTRLKKHSFDIEAMPLERIFLETDENDVSIAELYSCFANRRAVSEVTIKELIVENYRKIWPKV